MVRGVGRTYERDIIANIDFCMQVGDAVDNYPALLHNLQIGWMGLSALYGVVACIDHQTTIRAKG